MERNRPDVAVARSWVLGASFGLLCTLAATSQCRAQYPAFLRLTDPHTLPTPAQAVETGDFDFSPGTPNNFPQQGLRP